MGIHKCPAFTKHPQDSFIDVVRELIVLRHPVYSNSLQTMPEIIKAIFSLDELSQISGNPHSILNSVQVHPDATHVRLFFFQLIMLLIHQRFSTHRLIQELSLARRANLLTILRR